ncbi:MAG: hypothetical protein OXU62_08575 [Gammaproteobacteria bacterium]|nr:hypothetical protein [Gammaproteobacteria bacterium]
MTPKDERTKERVNFRSRILLAVVAGVYLLVGAVGGYLLEWFERDRIVWSEFAVMPTVGIAVIVIMSFVAVILYRAINGDIDQIGEPSCSKTST